MASDAAFIRGEIRTLVDPLFMRFREELLGSGVSYGRIAPVALPPTTVVVGGPGGTTDPNDLGFIRGIKVYSGGTLIGSDLDELSFLGAGVTVATGRATIDIATPLSAKITNPMTTLGDVIYGETSGTPTRLGIGASGYVLTAGGDSKPHWQSVLSDPTIAIGDIIYRDVSGLARLPIGVSGYLLRASGNIPTWYAPLNWMENPMTQVGDIIYGNTSGVPASLVIGTSGQVLIAGGDSKPHWASITAGALWIEENDGSPTDSAATKLIFPSGTLTLSGHTMTYMPYVPRQLAWYEETLTVATSKGPLRRIDANVTVVGCYLYVKTAPTGAALIVDIQRSSSGPNGTYASIFSALPQIAAAADNGSSTSLSISQLNAGDYVRMDITQIGSTLAGANLTVDLNMILR